MLNVLTLCVIRSKNNVMYFLDKLDRLLITKLYSHFSMIFVFTQLTTRVAREPQTTKAEMMTKTRRKNRHGHLRQPSSRAPRGVLGYLRPLRKQTVTL